MWTQRGTQAGEAVPPFLCNFALNAQEESNPRQLEGKLAEPPGMLNRRPKAPLTTLERHHFQLHELDAERQSEECHHEPSSQACWEKDLSSF